MVLFLPMVCCLQLSRSVFDFVQRLANLRVSAFFRLQVNRGPQLAASEPAVRQECWCRRQEKEEGRTARMPL